MAPDFRTYLSTQVVSEQNTISYRNVSRALRVHVNTAKCMLYEYYEDQNKRKPGSIYATYLVAGTKKTPKPVTETNGKSNGVRHDEDVPMPSSPPPFTSSMLEPSQHDSESDHVHTKDVATKTITLVREEAIEDIKSQYEAVTSIHIYSISPSRLPDLTTLTDIGRGLYTDVFAKEDPLEHNKTYGVIQNPQVRRRKGNRPVIPNAPAPKFQPVKSEPKSASKQGKVEDTKPSTTTTATLKREDSSRPSSRDSTSAKESNKPTLKRDASDLFKAFAKSKKPALKEAEAQEDTTMADAEEEGESEDEALFLDTNTRSGGAKKRVSEVKKEREDKAAKLRKMMDSDDEEHNEPQIPNVEDAADVKKAPPVARAGGDNEDEVDEVAWSDSDTEKQQQKAPGTDQSTRDEGEQVETSAPKRKRGKRKVMKKRTMKDENGYLVTREEPAWESFSEDDDQPEPSAREKSKTNAFGLSASKGGGGSQNSSQGQKSSAATAGGGKGGAKKGGGGNIMSFFGKK